MTHALGSKAPRVKWEAARVIGNTAHLNPQKLDEVIICLLQNSEQEGTVVRWSAAYALGAILQIKSPHQKELLLAIEAIVLREEKNSIRKIYLAAIKKSAL
jgi:HEAT repeat protein